MQIKVKFLGTGTSQGVPMVGCTCQVCKSNNTKDSRLRSSILISIDSFNILIDIGPDFRYQMLRINCKSVDAILFTHQHRDHTAGIDDLRPIYYKNKKPISLFAEKFVFDQIKSDFHYLFGTKDYPGKPKFKLNVIKNSSFLVSKILVTPIRVMHYKLPVFGYRIGDLAYITDANYIEEREKAKLFGIKVLIINSLQKDKHISHYNLDESLNLIDEVKPQKAYLTHIGHGMGLHNHVNKELPRNVYLAFDNLEIICS